MLYNPKALEAAELRGVYYGANIDTLQQEMSRPGQQADDSTAPGSEMPDPD